MSGCHLELSVVADGVAAVRWEDGPDLSALAEALAAVADDALSGGRLHRLEIALPSGRVAERRAVLRSGFRLEGTRRQALRLDSGELADELLFARLATDEVGGPAGASAVMNSALPRKRLIAHVLMRDQLGRVLLCETQFKPDWELPGGIVEPGETPRQGAIREVREELGIDLAVGSLLLVDWLPPYLGWEDAMELIFDGGTVTPAEVASYALQPSEIKRAELVTLTRAAALLTPIAHRRLSIAATLAPGAMAYTEDGSVPPA